VDLTTMDAPDQLGPRCVVALHDACAGLDAVVVIDDVSCGPAIGGVRMAVDVTGREVARLARAMTLKNAAAGLPHGGGKAGIVADPTMPIERKERLVRAFARAIRDLRDYIPGPDMGTDERCMAWVQDEIGRAVGLPRVLGGIPLDEVGATGFGLAICAEALESSGRLTLAGARVVLQGFGAVGRNAARFLVERGARIVGVADTSGALLDPAGLDVDELVAWQAQGNRLAELPGGTRVDPSELVATECELWIPAARPDVFTVDNAGALRAKIVLEGANIPATAEAEDLMHRNGILVVPDFVANAGGVICAAVEHGGGTQAQAFDAIEEKIRRNTVEMLARADERGISPRAAAEEMARSRIAEAAEYRRHL
jgi:glutamate dehydrogenase (NAD(P)+)/glutamate dehydrogenase (NADP+)